MFVEIEDRHQVVSFTREKGAVMLRVKRHAVVSLAASHGIPAHNGIRRGVDDRKNVLVLQVHVHLARDRVVLRHTGLAVEM